MGLSRIFTRAQAGVSAPLVTVETHLSAGLPAFSIVGLPEAAVKESRDRVRSALLNAGFEFPVSRITVNLSPADVPKSGAGFDLPIALGILQASEQLKADLTGYEFLGELTLYGDVRAVSGVLPAAMACQSQQRHFIVAHEKAEEAALACDKVYPAADLLAVCNHLHNTVPLPHQPRTLPSSIRYPNRCLSDVQGQHHAKRALEIAAAGGHSLLMKGPPGSGKSMLASRLTSLLPPLTEHMALESAAIYSLTEPRPVDAFYTPPYRQPHHTASSVALTGGGSHPKPGEISLAHHGVLFLDELPEYNRKTLEALREPIETGEVHIARAARQCCFPARFQLVAAMNPCPCGYLGDPEKSCGYRCEKALRYQQRISGPLLDRIDLHVEVGKVDLAVLTQGRRGETSAQVRQRVIASRQRQLQRQHTLNATLPVAQVEPVLQQHKDWLAHYLDKLDISARSLHRLIRVARTIADLADSDQVEQPHLLETLGFR